MILFHGSTIIIEHPLVHVGREHLDFGRGFYLTNIEDQASGWAKKVKIIKKSRKAIINIFEFDYKATINAGYKHLCMEEYNKEWLNFITQSRKGQKPWNGYDFIEGGVANDRVIDTVEDYMIGRITAEQALGQLKYAKPNHQICLLNQEIIDKYLTFIESKELL